MHNIVSETSVLKLKKHLGRWRRKAVQVEMLAEAFLLWMLMQPTEVSKARSRLGLWLQEEIQFHYLRYLFGISCVLGSGLQVAGHQDEWGTISAFKQLVKRIRQKPKSRGTRAKESYKQSGQSIMEEVEIRKALKGVLKDRIFNKWRSEILVKGAVLTHYTFPRHSLSPYLCQALHGVPGI